MELGESDVWPGGALCRGNESVSNIHNEGGHDRWCFMCSSLYVHFFVFMYVSMEITGWRRPIGCLKLRVIFCTRAMNYRAISRKMTTKDKAIYGSSPPCSLLAITRPRTRSAAMRHWSVLNLSAYERDLVTNERV